MKAQRILTCVLALALLLALAVELGKAKGPTPGAEAQSLVPWGQAQEVGGYIPVQGRLTDADGRPLAGDYDITFSLYDDPVAGTKLCSYTETVPVTDGLFTVNIGGICALPGVFTGAQLYLGIKVESDEEMVPRQPIYPVPYAQSLQPGAKIQGNVGGSVLWVENTRSTGDIIAVRGYAASPGGYGAYFDNAGATGGVGLYARGGGSVAGDVVLGGRASGGNDDDGRILSDPAYASSDLYLVSRDAIVLDLDSDDNEDGDLEVRNSSLTTILKASENGNVSLGINATGATAINIGDRYRDNAIIAWANVNSNGTIGWDFGVTAVTRAGPGDYIIEIDAETAGISSFVPIAIAEVESEPSSGDKARIVSINQTANSIFRVYITNGNWAMVDNQFFFMVTGR